MTNVAGRRRARVPTIQASWFRRRRSGARRSHLAQYSMILVTNGVIRRSHRAHRDFAGASGCLQHLAVAQIQGDVLAAAWAVKIRSPRLASSRRNVATGVITDHRRTGSHADPSEDATAPDLSSPKPTMLAPGPRALAGALERRTQVGTPICGQPG